MRAQPLSDENLCHRGGGPYRRALQGRRGVARHRGRAPAASHLGRQSCSSRRPTLQRVAAYATLVLPGSGPGTPHNKITKNWPQLERRRLGERRSQISYGTPEGTNEELALGGFRLYGAGLRDDQARLDRQGLGRFSAQRPAQREQIGPRRDAWGASNGLLGQATAAPNRRSALGPTRGGRLRRRINFGGFGGRAGAHQAGSRPAEGIKTRPARKRGRASGRGP